MLWLAEYHRTHYGLNFCGNDSKIWPGKLTQLHRLLDFLRFQVDISTFLPFLLFFLRYPCPSVI